MPRHALENHTHTDINKNIEKISSKMIKIEEYVGDIDVSIEPNLNEKIDIINKEIEELKQEQKDKLNSIDNVKAELDNLKKDITYVSNFKRLENETTDTERVQRAIDSCNGGKVLFEPNVIYRINKPLRVKKSNLELDFNNATLNWVGGEDLGDFNGRDRYYGCLTLEGVSEFTDNIISLTQNETTTNLVIESKLSSFAVGDWVYLSVATGAWGSWGKDYSDFKPCSRILTKIVAKSDTSITINYVSPFKFNEEVNGTIQKINPLNNISIKNLNYLDSTPYVETGGSGTQVDTSVRNTWVGGVHVYFCNNLVIENYSSKGQKFPALMLNKSALITLNNITANNAGTLGAGCGYGIQANGCYFINASNLEGVGIRHLIDFSGGAYHRVTNAKGDKIYKNFDCHGIGEHDIKFTNCVGNFAIGNGLTEFPEITDNIIIDKSDIIFDFNYCKNLKITNSTVNIQRGARVQNLSLENCTIKIDRRWIEISNNKRGLTESGNLIINNCRTKNNDEQTTSETEEGRLVLKGFDNVTVNSCTLENTRKDKALRQTSLIQFNNNKITKVSNSSLLDCNMLYSFTEDNAWVVYNNNNHIEYTAQVKENSYSPLDLATTTKMLFIADNNYYIFNSKNRWLRTILEQDINLVLRNNIFSGDITEYVNNSKLRITNQNNIIDGIIDKTKVPSLTKIE